MKPKPQPRPPQRTQAGFSLARRLAYTQHVLGQGVAHPDVLACARAIVQRLDGLDAAALEELDMYGDNAPLLSCWLVCCHLGGSAMEWHPHTPGLPGGKDVCLGYALACVEDGQGGVPTWYDSLALAQPSAALRGALGEALNLPRARLDALVEQLDGWEEIACNLSEAVARGRRLLALK